MKFARIFLSMALSMAAIYFAFGQTTKSANTSLTVKFDAKLVHIDPKLANHDTQPLTFTSDFESQLKELGKKYQLEFYVIAAEQGDDLGSNPNYWELDLSGQDRFESRKVVIIQYVRSRNNPQLSSVAVCAKGWLSENRRWNSDGSFGPDGRVLAAAHRHLPQNPQEAILAAAREVNALEDFQWFVSTGLVLSITVPIFVVFFGCCNLPPDLSIPLGTIFVITGYVLAGRTMSDTGVGAVCLGAVVLIPLTGTGGFCGIFAQEVFSSKGSDGGIALILLVMCPTIAATFAGCWLGAWVGVGGYPAVMAVLGGFVAAFGLASMDR